MKVRFFFYVICIVFLKTQSYATNNLNPAQLVDSSSSYIDSLNIQIEYCSSLNQSEIINLHNERGTLFFIVGEHDKAIDDFTYVLNTSLENPLIDQDSIGLALWGRAPGHAFLGKEEELLNDLNSIAEFTGLYTDCNCRHSSKQSDSYTFIISAN